VNDHLKINDLATRKQQEPAVENPIDVARRKNDSFQPLDYRQLPGQGMNMTTDQLNTFFKNMRENNTHTNNMHNGYLIVHVPQNQTMSFNASSALFNEKVIFVVDGSMNTNSNFPRAGNDANTMIYVGPSGSLGNGFGSQGDFKGLIYVHEDNKNNWTFQWGTSRIDGAILAKGSGSLNWNNGNTVTISRNEDVLAPFGCFVTGGSGTPIDNGTVIITDDTKPITIEAAGIFFR